ncbi:MAG: electron transfer flavoprotein subunit alpha/FixB family protein, partial [Deltaproteobacteria bacterium]|nr:electron transfer flavoprotein subunit alpha/FixB family protein [Deltaproteobacteria bacterium]
MATVLVVIEHAKGELKKSNLPAITAAREIAKHTGGDVCFAALGPGSAAAADNAKALGPAKIYVAEHAGLENFLAQPYAKVVA